VVVNALTSAETDRIMLTECATVLPHIVPTPASPTVLEAKSRPLNSSTLSIEPPKTVSSVSWFVSSQSPSVSSITEVSTSAAELDLIAQVPSL